MHRLFLKMKAKLMIEEFELEKQLKNNQVILDPYLNGNITEKWINKGLIWLMHARSVIPNNPKKL